MKYALQLLALLALASCTSHQPPTLDEQLAGKPQVEQEKILRRACINEAEAVGNSPESDIRNVHGVSLEGESARTKHIETLCFEMSGHHLRKSLEHVSPEERSQTLHQDCENEIATALTSSDPLIKEHAKAMRVHPAEAFLRRLSRETSFIRPTCTGSRELPGSSA